MRKATPPAPSRRRATPGRLASAAASSGPAEILRPGEIFCPVGRALDLLGDRWTLVLVRHLLGGPRGFRELRVRTGIAPRVLSARLRQLARDGLVEAVIDERRPAYALTPRGRTLEPIVASIARWWVLHAMEVHVAEAGGFTATSAQSILESLPFLLREERARDVERSFEIRLSGAGGGVWSVRIAKGECTVARGFAAGADVRYTADARTWCGVALGLVDPRSALAEGLLTKEGAAYALDHYFHQIARPARSGAGVRATRARAVPPPRKQRRKS